MRAAKLSLMFSASVFLLAVSWFLVTGQLGEVPPAHAQVPGDFVSVSTLISDGSESKVVAMTADGQVWYFFLSGLASAGSERMDRVTLLGTIGAPVSSDASSVSDLKRRYGDN